MLQLEIRKTIAFFIYLARIEHDAVNKISYCQFTETYRKNWANYHTERKWPETEYKYHAWTRKE